MRNKRRRQSDCNTIFGKGFSQKSTDTSTQLAGYQTESVRQTQPTVAGAMRGKRQAHSEVWGSRNWKANQDPRCKDPALWESQTEESEMQIRKKQVRKLSPIVVKE